MKMIGMVIIQMRYNKATTTDGEPKERKAKRLPVYVSENDFLKILKVSKHKHHKLAYMLAFYSGLRITEALNVEERDLDFKRGTILVRQGKGSKDGMTKIPKFFIKPMLYLLPLKQHCKQRALQKEFIKACEKSGVKAKKPKVHFHSLRHGFATECIRSGMSLSDVQDNLGHNDLATTSIYINLAPEERIQNYKEKFLTRR